MRALTLILASTDPARGRVAVALAAAHAALGAPTRLHVDAPAIGLLGHSEIISALRQAKALGVTISLCPTGLADAAIDPPPLPEAERHGLVTLLAELDDTARLVVI